MIDAADYENISEFRNGIFALRTRRFGTVAEIMIKKLYNFEEAYSLAFDKRDINTNNRIEVKFSTVMKENDEKIRDDNVIDQCIKANFSNRAMSSEDIEICNFDCNIQQIKIKEFDILYYDLFFADIIEIFKMKSIDIPSCPGYSNKQHRGNEGEGQFHLNQDNLAYHRKEHQELVITYQELYDLFRKK